MKLMGMRTIGTSFRKVPIEFYTIRQKDSCLN